jgi:hypothetical protein
MKAFRTKYDETSEQYERVVSMTAAFVESLYRAEDSLLREQKEAVDSTIGEGKDR